MTRTWLAALATTVAILVSTPALAANCDASRPGLEVEFSVHFGDAYTESEENEFALMRLRQMGVDATMVEKWGGCVRAFVRNGTGRGTHMELFNPRTLERVD